MAEEECQDHAFDVSISVSTAMNLIIPSPFAPKRERQLASPYYACHRRQMNATAPMKHLFLPIPSIPFPARPVLPYREPEFILCPKKSLCVSLADLLEHRSILDVFLVVCLELGGDSVQRALESIFRGGVHHFGLGLLVRTIPLLKGTNLDASIIWRPRNEGNLASVVLISSTLRIMPTIELPRSLTTSKFVVEVIDSVSRTFANLSLFHMSIGTHNNGV